MTPGKSGASGEDASRNHPRQGGTAGETSGRACDAFAGEGGYGGKGAGNSGGHQPTQEPSKDGTGGHGGCVALTYAPAG
ncbi:hypothetical protein [Streptomyces sp. cmx-18-6]|uniref:hypothetical protein n=1 Tax=Streptomyces sp. cmx-18-6 TaxID=2790930 RepID=UPI0039814BFA